MSTLLTHSPLKRLQTEFSAKKKPLNVAEGVSMLKKGRLQRPNISITLKRDVGGNVKQEIVPVVSTVKNLDF